MTTKTFDRTPRPTGCPWGAIQDARELAPGIWTVSTSSHGGILVSPQRLEAMPDLFRRGSWAGDGAYEEDCDWAAVAVSFPDAFPARSVVHAVETVRSGYGCSCGERGAEWLATDAGQHAVAVAEAWRRRNGSSWEIGSMGCGPEGTVMSFRRIGDGQRMTLRFPDGTKCLDGLGSPIPADVFAQCVIPAGVQP